MEIAMKKLYRSRRDKKLFGLCGGLAEMLNVDATLVRILLIVVTVFTSGALIVVYVLAGLVVPKNPYDFGGGYGPGPGGFGGGWSNNHHNGHFGGNHFGGHNPYGPGSTYGNSFDGASGPSWQKPPAQTQATPPSNIDAMMEDLEKRALKKEIEELRAKLAKHEKGDV